MKRITNDGSAKLKKHQTWVLVTVLLFLPALYAHAQLVPWAGVLANPDDPDSVMNQTENLQAYEESQVIEEDAAPNFGPSDTSIYNIGPSDWQVRGNTFDLGLDGNRNIGPSTSVTAPVHLPSGSLITSVTIYYNDTGASNPSAGLWCGNTAGGEAIITNFDPCFPSFSGGNRLCTIGVNHTVNNANCHYGVLLILNADNLMYRMRFNYRLQISPAPLFATFNDVPTFHPFFKEVEALVDSGITGGCGGGNYCPDSPVTRGQMAAFLARALGLHWPN